METAKIDGYRNGKALITFGDLPDEGTLAQAYTCMSVGPVAAMALMADKHLGYCSMPVGGVVSYRGAISPSGVGVDIACGVKAVRTTLGARVFSQRSLSELLDEIEAKLPFGMGRNAHVRSDHPVMDSLAWRSLPKPLEQLRQKAAAQLGSVGGGNHYVDILIEPEADGSVAPNSPVWVAAHFGSRGFGKNVGRYFMAELGGKDGPNEAPTIAMEGTKVFEEYVAAMTLAGEYAYAGRDSVIAQVLGMLGTKAVDTVHNHHNWAWLEEHDGEMVWVVRKGATPAQPGQRGFVGGSMGDMAAIVEGVDSPTAVEALRSTVHGAGRLHSRGWAKGKWNRKTGEVTRPGNVSDEMMAGAVAEYGVEVRGGDVDESPMVYRKLAPVLEAMGDSIVVKNVLRPIGVVMAPRGVRSDDG